MTRSQTSASERQGSPPRSAEPSTSVATSARLAIVATGGTIQNTPGGRVRAEDVLSDLRAHPDATARLDGVEVVVDDIVRKGAEDLVLDDWLAIARAVQARADDPAITGIVVTHGTFTAEETAYLLHLVVPTTKPVVLVVAQRKHGTLGGDGARNLLDALRVAADPSAAGRGVLLVSGEEIHSARDVTKLHRRPSGFDSGIQGIVGTIDEDRSTFYRRIDRWHTSTSMFGLADLERFARVDIIAAYVGADDVAIDAFVAAGARGLVTSGYVFSGIGTPLQQAALERVARSGIPVVLASRGRGGRSPESGGDWYCRADDFSPQKARILLGLALGRGLSRPDIQHCFDVH